MVKGWTHLLVSQGGRRSGEFQSSTSTVRLWVVNREDGKSQFWEHVQKSAFPSAGLCSETWDPHPSRISSSLKQLKFF